MSKQTWRKRLASGLLSVCLAMSVLPVVGRAATATNDLRRHWAAPVVYTLMQDNIITGYSDRTFRPNQAVTREEAVALLNAILDRKALGWNLSVGSPDIAIRYSDLSSSWAKEQVDEFARLGIGLDPVNGCFLPTKALTRGEAAILTNLIVCRWSNAFSLSATAPATGFADMVNHPARQAVEHLQQLGVLSGKTESAFCPDDTITRAEFSVILLHLSGKELLTDVQYDPLPTRTVIDVPYISQVYPVAAWVGCEPTSLLMGLKGKGYAQDVTLTQFLDNLPKAETNPAKGFVGSPYQPSETLRTTIYPAPLAEYGRTYGANTVDFSGQSVEALQEEVLLGNPVVIYVTLYWKTPYYRNFNIDGTTQSLLRNNHAVLVCGYDQSTDQYYIADPYNINDRYHDYFYWIDADILEPLYMVRQHAVAVR